MKRNETSSLQKNPDFISAKITPLLLLSLELYLSSSIKNDQISNLRKNLVIQARLIADQIPSSLTRNLDDFCKRVKEKSGARVTIIDSSGAVLGDSDEPSEKKWKIIRTDPRFRMQQ